MVLRKGYNYVRPEETEGESAELAHSDPHDCAYEQLEHDLKDELYETIEVSTHFGPLIGTLVAVKEDYLVLVDATGSVLLVPYYNIEFISYT